MDPEKGSGLNLSLKIGPRKYKPKRSLKGCQKKDIIEYLEMSMSGLWNRLHYPLISQSNLNLLQVQSSAYIVQSFQILVSILKNNYQIFRSQYMKPYDKKCLIRFIIRMFGKKLIADKWFDLILILSLYVTCSKATYWYQ